MVSSLSLIEVSLEVRTTMLHNPFLAPARAAAFFVAFAVSPVIAETPFDTDFLTFAQGALPLELGQDAEVLRVGPEHAIALIDGNPAKFAAMRRPATAEQSVAFHYALPAPTEFSGFFVPNIQETPSPSQTFFKNVAVSGSSEGPEGPFVPLASGVLETHTEDDQVTALTLEANQPKVQWVRVVLQGGVDVQADKSFLEFSELIGTGVQDEAPISEGFQGVWAGRGVKLELEQNGATVTGCYDGESMLTGTVSGNVLRALGVNAAGIPSQFILLAGDDGSIQGLRSTNGAPFSPYNGAPSDNAASCLAPEPPKLGCGSIVHGIQFDLDSDVIRPSSSVVLADLYEGLRADGADAVTIVGHSSSEGADDYNRGLSERRAASVAKALVALGLNAATITAAGRGEDEPIASNADEAGRSLNRRVEVQCTG